MGRGTGQGVGGRIVAGTGAAGHHAARCRRSDTAGPYSQKRGQAMTQTTNALPEALYSAAQVAAFDQRLINDFGVPGFTLMQRAAAAAYSALKRRWPYARRLCVFCGPGNNGGDGYLIGRLALEAGQQVRLISMVAASSLHGDAARARAAFEAVGGQVEAFVAAPVDADVVIDGLLGTGLSRDVAGHYA